MMIMYKINENYFKIIDDKEKAYFLGIFYESFKSLYSKGWEIIKNINSNNLEKDIASKILLLLNGEVSTYWNVRRQLMQENYFI